MVSASFDATFCVWTRPDRHTLTREEAASGADRRFQVSHHNEHAHTSAITKVVDLGNGTMVTASYEMRLAVWSTQARGRDVGEYQLLTKLRGHDTFVKSIGTFVHSRPVGSALLCVTGGGDKRLVVWDETHSEVASADHGGGIPSGVFQHTSGKLISVGSDGIVRVWV